MVPLEDDARPRPGRLRLQDRADGAGPLEGGSGRLLRLLRALPHRIGPRGGLASIQRAVLSGAGMVLGILSAGPPHRGVRYLGPPLRLRAGPYRPGRRARIAGTHGRRRNRPRYLATLPALPFAME